MRARGLLTLLLVGSGGLLSGTPAGAAQVNEVPAASGTTDVTAGPDGNLWVTQPFADSVARYSPAGALLNTWPVGAAPSAIASAPDGRVWASVPSQKRLVWFDAQAAAPSLHPVSTTAASACGPLAIAPGPDAWIYFSLPSTDGCQAGVSRLGVVSADGSGAVSGVLAGGGEVYDLAIVGGKLFAPDFAGGVVRRLGLGATPVVEATYTAPLNASPDGITAGSDGKAWVTGWANGAVYTVAAGAATGTPLTPVPLSGGTLSSPFGIAEGPDGKVYVAGRSSANLVAIDPASQATTFFPLPGAEPMGMAKAADGRLWIADELRPRVLQFVPDSLLPTLAPVATPGPAPIATPAPAAPAPAPAALPKVAAKVTISSSRRGATTTVTGVRVSGLAGGESITIRCSKGCGFSTKRYAKLKGTSVTYGKSVFKGRRLTGGAIVTVTVSKPGRQPKVVTLQVRKGKKPTITVTG